MFQELRYRQVHLDFHTSEHISGIGERFDPEEFVETLKWGNVDSVTLFARGHHGWCYYPTKIGKPHPHLARPDLLGEMVTACQEADIATPIYHTAQWDELIAREHPEWRAMPAENKPLLWAGDDNSTSNQLTATWHSLCLNNPEYVDYLIALIDETVDRYAPPGIFIDIIFAWQCVCPRCLARMEANRRDAENEVDRQQNDREVIMEFYDRVSSALRTKSPNTRLFFNSGHVYRGERERYRHFSHLEIESLPTGGWGYDHFPVSARYADSLGMEFLGMTGKFHTSWGEFGGYKRAIALEYECSHMVALGARCSIGDQLHPDGHIDKETYSAIRPAYARIKKLEPYLRGATYESQIAVLSEAAFRQELGTDTERTNTSDEGAVRMLLELHHPFDVVDGEADFSGYDLLVLPDAVPVEGRLVDRLNRYLADGGALILSGASGMNAERTAFAMDLGVEFEGERSPWSPDFLVVKSGLDDEVVGAPFVMYDSPYVVKSRTGTVWGRAKQPYFNREWNHFCSHQHAPVDSNKEPYGDAIVQSGSVFYFAHPVFRLYHESGQPMLKYLVRGAIGKLIETPLVETSLPSAGRASVTYQSNEKRHVVHLLYAPTQKRGSEVYHADGGAASIEIIEDVPEIGPVECRVRLDQRPSSVREVLSGQDLEWEYRQGYLRFTVPKMHVHTAVAVE